MHPSVYSSTIYSSQDMEATCVHRQRKCIKKMWYIRTRECYSAMKMNDIMPLVATWIDLEIVIMSEESEKDTYTWYHLACGI